ncbi:hypothetical protein FLG15_18285 [Xanthomonas phaseoli pv. dieffenbachiae]|uniref:Uncharacterized protein n=5 Tax=Xanthomonas phaseoli TaxID=1985254 RepID=A0AB38E783_XANCH|nr:hypothetical protein XabCFBP2524_05315 [Xanthomonas axonopodis pv. begoniae]QWN26062.1 hypothetical protein DGM93_18710 [Xanthomonas phaseoli pv. phaseoli]RWU14252.1 hypothetical protein XANMN_18465 [Xanthomonas phaseoli pv. manihotis str. CIO151]QWN34380.1 hypothetical protein DGM81_18470 [Xanthomonas phaseoli pv. phaseoli]SON87697.1 conserved hypothetical protein [Xanthomonas phaseoli pv. phaseoli]
MDTHSYRTKSASSAPAHMPSDVRLQFIDWAKQHGHNPASGAAAFVALQSEVDLDLATRALQLEPNDDPRAALREHLAALARQVDVAVQFPPVYTYTAANGLEYRYSLMLVIAEDCVEWTGRVWHDLDYQGMLTGRGQGPRANYTQLARMALEHELDQERPRYVQA